MLRKRRRVGRDDVDVDAEPVGEQPDRLLDALDPVDRVERRMACSTTWPPRSIAFPGVEQLVDVGLLDLVAAELDLDIGDVADEAAGAEACPHLVDGDARHALGKLDRLADRELARFHVGDVAALDAAAFALAGAEHAQPAVLVGVTISALTLDEPMSSAAISGCSAGCGHGWLTLLRGSARSASPGARGSRTIILPGMRRSKRTSRGRAGPTSGPSWRTLQRRARRLAFGQARPSRRTGSAGPSGAADPGRRGSCGFSVGTAPSARSSSRAPGGWRRGRSAAAGRASGRPARGRAPRLRVDQRELLLVLARPARP
jgi:hypothetical protein